MTDKRLALFASGSGTNVENIIRFFRNSPHITTSLVVCNNPEAGVIDRARNYNIPVKIIDKQELNSAEFALYLKKEASIDFIVLAGFLWLIPPVLIREFPDRIVNIHPALLPKYGGKGMYGMNVHRRVLEEGEKKSGISIHYVNENYDEGNLIFQAFCPVEPGDGPEDLAQRVHDLEYRHYPEQIKKLVESL
jgi:phosphoribosylglycinamide formyltransferase-1